MAIWQFWVELIPRKNLLQRFGEIPKGVDDELFCQYNLEEGVILPSNYETILSSLGEKEILKWTKFSQNWGDYDKGSHLTIDCYEENKVSVFSRLDVGNWDEGFARKVLEFTQLCECVLLTKNQTIIEPDFHLLIKEVRNSNSYRFCVNPAGYLQSDEVKQLNSDIKKKFF